MKLGARIALYAVLCSLWAGLLFGAAALRYSDEDREVYAIQVERNNQIIKHRLEMAEIEEDNRWIDVEARLYRDCLKTHPTFDPEFCSSMAKLDVATARLRAAHKAHQ
jgi:hypothetical protein